MMNSKNTFLNDYVFKILNLLFLTEKHDVNFDVKYLICLFDTFNFRNYEKHFNIYFSSVFCVNF